MESVKESALEAFRLLFRPVARFLLRAGVNWKELAEVGKATYVEIASDEFGIKGRPTNMSRVAILTGFTRREVRRLRSLLEQDNPAVYNRMNHATRVLSGWHQDEGYVDRTGHPIPLNVTGGNPSFEALCHRYSSDVPATTLLKELRHVGAVHENRSGKLVARTRYYMPVLMDPEQMLRSGDVLADIGKTVVYNLHRRQSDPSRFERRATNTRMAPRDVSEFRKFVEVEAQAFLERIDAWLSDHEQADNTDSECVRLGLGTYWIEEATQQRKKS